MCAQVRSPHPALTKCGAHERQNLVAGSLVIVVVVAERSEYRHPRFLPPITPPYPS
jgi:hypothetical protein